MIDYIPLWFHIIPKIIFYHRVNSNANADLLGLSTPPAGINNTGGSGTLIDVLGDIYGNNNAATYNTKKFLFKNNGVLFENEMLQIGVKSEFRQNLGRLGLFYGNKTQIPLTVCTLIIFNCLLINMICLAEFYASTPMERRGCIET